MRDVSKAYPIYAGKFDIALKTTLAELDKLEVSADAALKASVQKLRDDLDNTSSRLEMRLKTAVMGLQTMPCDQTARDEFWKALKLVNEKTDELERLPPKIRSPEFNIESLDSVMSELQRGFEL